MKFLNKHIRIDMPRISFLFFLVIASFMLVFTTLAAAQERGGEEGFFALEDSIVITASKTSEWASDSPASIYVITKEDIQKYGYTSLEQALARSPEVFNRFNGHHFSADFRGFFLNNNERRVLYLLNGNKLNDRFHFGDQSPDIISDLSNVERIEVVRGPGAALYGNNSILGTVNIITKEPTETKATKLTVEGSNIKSGSLQQKYQVIHNKKYSDSISVNADIFWLTGKIAYDTQTNWASTQGTNGQAANRIYHDWYFNVDDQNFEEGMPLPNWNIRLQIGDFILGSYNYTKRVNWIWPKDKMEFNHPDNERVWGTFSTFLKFVPREGALKKLDFSATLSYNTHTNRETAVWLENGVYPASTRLQSNVFGGSAWVMRNGVLTNYITETFGPTPAATNSAFSSATINANGGGTKFVYAGIDKTTAFDFQITPFRMANDLLQVMVGGNFDYSNYENYHRYAYLNNQMIGWAPWGGISDKGYNGGAWAQFIIKPTNALRITTGVRFDYQKIAMVQRQLGGEQLYRSDGTPILFEDKIAKDITPRITINYRFNKDHNLRLIYGQAFRAVAAQELVRLPVTFGEAQSEKTNNFEAIYSGKVAKTFGFSLNAFYIAGDFIYQWSPADSAFAKGSGWKNTGGSLELKFLPIKGLELWSNSTLYSLKRSTDAYNNELGAAYQKRDNELKSLDSPTLLQKIGGSYSFMEKTTIGLELLYNGGTETIVANSAKTDFETFKIPASTTINLSLSKVFPFGLTLMAKVNNLLDQDEFTVLPIDAENFAAQYQEPNQLPGYGRTFTIMASMNF